MGSSLQVESENGKDIDFYFIIKQQVINWEVIGNFADSYKKYHGNTLKKKNDGFFTAPNANILVVDDTEFCVRTRILVIDDDSIMLSSMNN